MLVLITQTCYDRATCSDINGAIGYAAYVALSHLFFPIYVAVHELPQCLQLPSTHALCREQNIVISAPDATYR